MFKRKGMTHTMSLCNQTRFVTCLLTKCLNVFHKTARTHEIYSVYMFLFVLTRSSRARLYV